MPDAPHTLCAWGPSIPCGLCSTAVTGGSWGARPATSAVCCSTFSSSLPSAFHSHGTKRVRGGIQSERIGFLLHVARCAVGISASRAVWAVCWLGNRAQERRVQPGELCEGLGLFQFPAGPLEHYPEFQRPLGKYRRVHPDRWEFTRDFEHVSVSVDTEKWPANLDWK